MAIYGEEELRALGLRHCGRNVRLSRMASLYGIENISLGDNVRIDDFCVLSAGLGGIDIGRNVHVAVFCSLIGRGRISVGDFANLSSRVSIYSSSDDYSGRTMTNPTLPPAYTGAVHADVTLGKHVIVGCGSVILPGVRIGIGAAVGSLSLVRTDCHEFTMYAGTPAREIGPRDRNLLALEAALREEEARAGNGDADRSAR
ncbi:MAG: acyltransferase [Rhodocyclaceae bacterium]|nr:acyltransferase [Rhodocyclaceae bacterium]